MDQKNKSDHFAKRFSGQWERYKKTFEKFMENEQLQKKYAVTALSALLAVGTAFLLAHTPMLFGCVPMGLSLLCAAQNDLIFLWMGCFLGALDQGEAFPVFLAVYTCVFVFRFTLSLKAEKSLTKLRESLGTRVLIALVGALILGLYGCIAEQFTLHALFALLFYLLSSGALTFLLSGLFVSSDLGKFFYKTALITLGFCVVFAAGTFRLFGFSADLMVATLFVLLFSKKENPVFSAIAGMALGLACGRDYAPVLALCGLVSATLGKISKKTAPWLGILSGFGWAFYAMGSTAFLYTLPDLVSGLLLYTPLNAYLEKKEEAQNTLFSTNIEEHARTDENLFRQSLETLSEKLTALSQNLRMPTSEQAYRICQSNVEDHCRSCGGNCFSKKEALSSLSETLFETGKLSLEKPPKTISSGCTRYKLLCDSVNNDYAAHLKSLLDEDRADSYALCYRGIASLLRDREALSKKEEEQNEEIKERFAKALNVMHIGYEELSVVGQRTLHLKAKGVRLSDIRGSAKGLRSAFEKECGMRLSLPELICTQEEQSLLFRRVIAFDGELGALSQKKEGEDYCGDTVYSFRRDNYLYFLLCDGMGSGRDAALVSRIACHFIEQLSSCNGSLETVLQTVNDFLLGQKSECSTTVDLLRLDLYDGSCTFIKSGACPSLILRGQNTFKISSLSMPIGATREINCEKISLKLKPGDYVIMASDGVASDLESAPWLSALLTGKLREKPQELAEDLLSYAQKEDLRPDDRSIMVIRVMERTE